MKRAFSYPIEIDSEVVDIEVSYDTKTTEWDARVMIDGLDLSIYERLTPAEERDIDARVNREIAEDVR